MFSWNVGQHFQPREEAPVPTRSRRFLCSLLIPSICFLLAVIKLMYLFGDLQLHHSSELVVAEETNYPARSTIALIIMHHMCLKTAQTMSTSAKMTPIERLIV